MTQDKLIGRCTLKSTGGNIKFKKNWGYTLVKDYSIQTCITPDQNIYSEYFRITRKGKICVSAGYNWDAASGPAIDTPNFMRGSLIHDVCYQAIREGQLDPKWRLQADQELRRICREDGMNRVRAWWVYWGVRWFAGFAANPKS